jgi:hypothetical protein
VILLQLLLAVSLLGVLVLALSATAERDVPWTAALLVCGVLLSLALGATL